MAGGYRCPITGQMGGIISGDVSYFEFTATITAYNMVSRFFEALQIHADSQDGKSTWLAGVDRALVDT